MYSVCILYKWLPYRRLTVSFLWYNIIIGLTMVLRHSCLPWIDCCLTMIIGFIVKTQPQENVPLLIYFLSSELFEFVSNTFLSAFINSFLGLCDTFFAIFVFLWGPENKHGQILNVTVLGLILSDHKNWSKLFR